MKIGLKFKQQRITTCKTLLLSLLGNQNHIIMFIIIGPQLSVNDFMKIISKYI